MSDKSNKIPIITSSDAFKILLEAYEKQRQTLLEIRGWLEGITRCVYRQDHFGVLEIAVPTAFDKLDKIDAALEYTNE